MVVGRVSFHKSNPTSLDSPPVLIQQSISSLSHSSAWTQLIIYHLHTITLLPYVWDIFVDSECWSVPSQSRPIILIGISANYRSHHSQSLLT